MKHWVKQFFLLLAFLMCLSFAVPVWAAEASSIDYTYKVNDDGSSVTITKYKGDGGNITIPSRLDGYTVTAIGDKAFNYNDDGKELISVTIPGSVTSIGNYAFSCCTSLTSIIIPDSVTYIGQSAFAYCPRLTSITIPAGVTSISDLTFNCCYQLVVTIPDSVTSIGNYAFQGCRALTSITIPGSVTTIGNYAFNCCYGLTSVTIQEGVKSIGKYAFSGGIKLTRATVAKSVTSIGIHAFGYFPAEKNGSTTSNSNFVLYGYTGSTAQIYAEKNNITFKVVGTTTKKTPVLKFKSATLVKAVGDKDFTNELTENTDGKISYKSSNTKVATVNSSGKVSIKGVGTAKITAEAAAGTEYAAVSKSYTLKVNPGKVSLSGVKNIKSRKMKVTWKKNTTGTGYQIQYSTSSKFSNSKTVTVSKNKTTSATISKLTKGKKYYVRIRSYKKVSGKTYYSAWSSKKSETIKK